MSLLSTPENYFLNGKMYGWASTKFTIGDGSDEGASGLDSSHQTYLEKAFQFFQGLSYSEGQGVTLIHATGPMPKGAGYGQYGASGSLTFLKEAEAVFSDLFMQYGGRQGFPPLTLSVTYGDPITAGLDEVEAPGFTSLQVEVPKMHFGVVDSGLGVGDPTFGFSMPFVALGRIKQIGG